MWILGVDTDIFKHKLRILAVIHYFKSLRIIWPWKITVTLVP